MQKQNISDQESNLPKNVARYIEHEYNFFKRRPNHVKSTNRGGLIKRSYLRARVNAIEKILAPEEWTAVEFSIDAAARQPRMRP